MTTTPRSVLPSVHPFLDLPPADHATSSITGVTRQHWEATADQLLLALRPFTTEDGARILPPGRHSGSGPDSDGLEGFARSFVLLGALLAGNGGADPHGHADRYARGLAVGVDPDSPNRWPRPTERPQAKVEACCLALALDLSREWIWERLDVRTRSRLVDWFAEVIGTSYPPQNWRWFRIVVLTFLRSVDDRFRTGDHADAVHADLEADLAIHESCHRGDGWFYDGVARGVDHYNTWAFALFPALWLRMHGACGLVEDGLVTPADAARHRERLAAFTTEATGLVGGDGAPLVQGRSLVYRMATAAPFWSAALAGLTEGARPELDPGLVRRAASGELLHFLRHGVPDASGLLTLGWFDALPGMAQVYSGPGSPYWASMGFLGLALPASHPVWTASEQPLPVETGDDVSALDVPGWIVSRTAADGIVRVLNHGTDHALPGQARVDSPLYARLGYSTATSPPLIGPGALDPRDSMVSLVDPELGWSHRTGFDRLHVGVEPARDDGQEGRVGIGISRHQSFWVRPTPGAQNHGHGLSGEVTHGAGLTIASIVCGATEVRIVRAEQDTELPVAIAGWPLSGPGEISRADDGDSAVTLTLAPPDTHGRVLVSTVWGLRGRWWATMRREENVSPLGPGYAVPQLMGARLGAGDVAAVGVELRGTAPETRDPSRPSDTGAPVRIAPSVEVGHDGDVRVVWGDGTVTRVPLPR